MITRFRVEGKAETRDGVIDLLQHCAGRIMQECGDPTVEWECTDDVITRTEGGYRGRMVFKVMEEEIPQFPTPQMSKSI